MILLFPSNGDRRERHDAGHAIAILRRLRRGVRESVARLPHEAGFRETSERVDGSGEAGLAPASFLGGRFAERGLLKSAVRA